jgi:hypothetical protein
MEGLKSFSYESFLWKLLKVLLYQSESKPRKRKIQCKLQEPKVLALGHSERKYQENNDIASHENNWPSI